MRPRECSFEGLRPVQVRLDDFIGQLAMLARIAAQRAHFELAAGLQGADDAASLLASGTHYRDQFPIAHTASFVRRRSRLNAPAPLAASSRKPPLIATFLRNMIIWI